MTAKTYNRIETKMRELGEIVTRSGPAPLVRDYAIVESILERRRPSHCLPRSESVNMRDDRDFRTMGISSDCGYVHVLEPLSAVETRDVEWIGALQLRYPKAKIDRPDRYPNLSDDDLADRYWNGEPSSKPSFEHVTRKAKIIDVEDKLSPVRPSLMQDALMQVAEYDKKNSNLL